MKKRIDLFWWFIPVLLLATALAARLLNADILFVDEYWSIRNSGGAYFGGLSPSDIWATMAEVDPGGMGILYHWLLAGFLALVGSSEFVLRLFSLFAGLLAIAFAFRTGALLYSRQTGFIAGTLLATSALFIDYMHEGRAYTLLVLLVIFTLWAYLQIIQPHRTASECMTYQVLLSLGLAGLAYTHYIGLVMLPVIGLIHLYSAPHRFSRGWWMTIGAIVMGGVLYLPWLSTAFVVLSSGINDSRAAVSMTVPQILEQFFHGVSNGNLALMLLLALMGIRLHRRNSIILLIWIILALIAVLIVNTIVPFMLHVRYLFIVFPAVLFLMSAGIQYLTLKKIPLWALLAAWSIVGLWQISNPAFIDNLFGQVYRAPLSGVERGIDNLRSHAQADDVVLFHMMPPSLTAPAPEPALYFVLPHYLYDIPVRHDQFERMNNSFTRNDNLYLADVDTVLQDANTVWTLKIPGLPTSNLHNVTQFVLDTRYARCDVLLDDDTIFMEMYSNPTVYPARLQFETETTSA
ncbi:MAG: glycosyltransferase family 39 protein, partial [Aggregatilineales bacterium]